MKESWLVQEEPGNQTATPTINCWKTRLSVHSEKLNIIMARDGADQKSMFQNYQHLDVLTSAAGHS